MIHPSASLHPTAIIHENAILDEDVCVGPYCVIGEYVHLKRGVRLLSHVCVEGRTTLDEYVQVFPFASIGHRTQDLKYKGEPSTVYIGKHTTIREYATIQPGTEGGIMTTKVGDHCLLMVGTHVAHDCVVGNHVIMANYATLAGHITVDDHVIIGGLSAVHQYVRIGAHAIIGGMSGVEKDVVPYALIVGERAYFNGINLVGLRRRGFSVKTIHHIQNLYQAIFNTESPHPFMERVIAEKEHYETDSDDIKKIFDFLETDASRHFCMPKKK
jgi:UDP-N-acetylglucosamine acyltransferase